MCFTNLVAFFKFYFLLYLLGWVSDVRSAGKGVKILPRLLFEGWTLADFQNVFASVKNMKEVGNFIAKNLKVNGNTCNYETVLSPA